MQIFRTRKIIDDAGADAVLAAAEAFALEQGSRVVIAIVDPSGELIQLPGAVNFAFADGTLLITTDTAIWAAQLSAKGA